VTQIGGAITRESVADRAARSQNRSGL